MAETDNMNLALPGSNEYVDVEVLNENFRKIDAAVLLALAAAAPYSAKTYALGAYCTKGGRLYRCTTAITAAETWTAGHWTETTVTAELIAHATSKSNPHGVTAAQTGAYSKEESDTLLAKKMVSELGQAGANLLEWASAQTVGGAFYINPTVTTADVPIVTWYAGLLEVNGGSRRMIISTSGGGAPKTYVNVTSAGVWQGWERLATATDLDTKVSKSGDTITGTLKLTDNIGTSRIKGVKFGMYLCSDDFGSEHWQLFINRVADGTIGDSLTEALMLCRTNAQDGWITTYPVLHVGNAQTFGFPKIAIGSYVGTGTYSSANPNSLTFDFEPKVVIIVLDGNSLFPGTVFIRGQGHSETIGQPYMCNANLTLTWSGNTVSWYTTNESYKESAQMNISGSTYRYIALG